MKRNLYACLTVAAALALCLGLAGCGGSSGTSASSGAGSSSSAEAASTESASSSSGNAASAGDAASSSASSEKASTDINKTIVDDDLCTIRVLDTAADDDVVGYNVEVTNKSDRTLTFMTGGRSGENTVDGQEASFIFYEEVEAGQTAQSEFQYWTSDLGGGVEKLVNVKGVINVNDMSIPDTIATYEFEL